MFKGHYNFFPKEFKRLSPIKKNLAIEYMRKL